MTTPLREVFARFGVDFEDKDLKKANQSVKGITDKLREFGAVIAGAAIVRGISNFIGETVRMGAELNNTAASLGIAVQELQAFQLAAELGGMEGQNMAQALSALQEKAFQAAEDGGDLAGTFSDLGIDLRDGAGELRGAGDLFRDLADGIQANENPSERVAIAMELMGEEGRRLVPILAGGSEGLAQYTEEMARLGGLSTEAIEDATEMADTLTRFRLVLLSIRSQIAVAVLPAFRRLTGWLGDAIILFRDLTERSRFMQVAIVAFAAVAVAAGASVLAAWLPQMLFFGLLAAAILIVILAIDDLIIAFEGGDSVLSSMVDEVLAATGTWIRFRDVVNEVAVALQLVADTWNVVGGFIRGVAGAGEREGIGESQFTGEERGATLAGTAVNNFLGGTGGTAATVTAPGREKIGRQRVARAASATRRRQEAAAEQARRQGIGIPARAPTVPAAPAVASIPTPAQQTIDARTEVNLEIVAQGADANEVATLAARKVEQQLERHRRETAEALGVTETS